LRAVQIACYSRASLHLVNRLRAVGNVVETPEKHSDLTGVNGSSIIPLLC
jgi:hypothetical protein